MKKAIQYQTTPVTPSKKSKKKIIIWSIIGTVLLAGVSVGGWQIYEYWVKTHQHVDRRINISHDGGNYTSNKAKVTNTSQDQLLLALKTITTLKPDLLQVLNDNHVVVKTNDHLIYNGQYQSLKIIIDASDTINYQGTAAVTMSIATSIIDISHDGGEFLDSKAQISDTNLPTLVRAIISAIPNLNPDLKGALQDSNIYLTTTDKLQYDGQYHPMKIDINANNTKNYFGEAFITISVKAKTN
ncbi:hypothetical protein P344_03350 [Spiroplasma mirum ATCC 29335]|uniref:Uncharacterized protein n=1 Tax=Spiroplasma mirum ATCC 29335 TaxID=838561 RepID=W0GLD9_9MOLU|nr:MULTISPECIES: hypothetical protein [Spiroplasma]AHF60992.1 hypothetical protein SMM_0567 [Spiroplasma mirum ATCC 29335]AHI58013.1 hypothetical protein P344_03350 [Spiroplasma mirum ATCC 29335]AKM53094.1 hypothetical protein SATRI_v1c06220 [Spiroplasma atrichopogonis]